MRINFSAALIGAVGENYSLIHSYQTRNHREEYALEGMCPVNVGERVGLALKRESHSGPVTIEVSSSIPKGIASFGPDIEMARKAVGDFTKGIQNHWGGEVLVE